MIEALQYVIDAIIIHIQKLCHFLYSVVISTVSTTLDDFLAKEMSWCRLESDVEQVSLFVSIRCGHPDTCGNTCCATVSTHSNQAQQQCRDFASLPI